MKHLAIIFVFGAILLTGNIFGQKTARATKFSSRYTNLDSDCKTRKGGTEGTDDTSDCRGLGGYRVLVGAAAAAEMIGVQTPDKKDIINIAMQDFDFDQTKIKVEWRLANGKPFAVIMRVFTYGDKKKNENDYWGKKNGEELRVVGLKGFENIDFTVDAKTPGANLKAREMADNGYRQAPKK
jgi:hypothetical protein